MKNKTLIANSYFLTPMAAIWLAIGVLQILYRQGIIALWVNQRNSSFFDVFFKYFTHFGDGIFTILLSLGLFFYRKSWSISVFLSYAFSGILAQLIKNFAFSDEPRPAQYFGQMLHILHTVDGVELLKWHSFPSGHTTSAFAVFGTIAFLTKNKWLQVGCLVVAILVGYSRMYLFQHFLVDVWAGALLGVGTAFFVKKILSQNQPFMSNIGLSNM